MDSDNIKANILRKKAQEVISKESNTTKADSSNFEEVIHELRVHQIELELQNQELMEAQIKIKESQHKYFDLYNFAPVGYFTLNKEGLILDVNFTGAELVNIDKENLKKSAFIQYITIQDRNNFHNHIKMALETGNKQSFDVKFLKEDEMFYAHLDIIPVIYENGIFKQFNIAVTDIRDIKNTERALRKSESYSEIFFNNHTVMILIDPDNLDIVDANPAAINFYGYTMDEIVKLKISDINVLDNDIVTEEMVNAISEQKNHFIFKHRLANGELRDVDVYSGLIKRKGRNLLYSIIHDISERKKSEENLKRQAALLDVSYEAIFSWEYDGNILSWNKGAERLYGYRAKEAVGNISHELLKTQFLIEFKEFKKKLMNDKMWKGELTHITKDGQKIIVETRHQLIQDPLGKKIVIESNRDITERKNAEKAINQSQKLLQDIINGFPSPIFVKDLKGRFLIINNKLEELLGVKNEELVGKTDHDIITKELAEFYRTNDEKVIEGGKAISIEEEANMIDGHHHFIAHKFPIYNIKDEPYGVGSISTDITELKKTERNLKESEERLRLAQSLGNVGIWDWNVITDELHFTPELEQLYGLIPGTIKTYQDWLQLTHPDDIEKIEAERKEKITNHEPFDLEFRILHNSGEIHWLSAKGGAIYNDKEEVLRVLGVNIDITERINRDQELKILMKELEQSNKELEQFAYITSHDLREPLRMITSFLQLLERRYKDQLDDDANEFIGFAVDGAKRLDAMTNDLLQYSKITSEKREIKPVNFEYVLKHALTNLKVPIDENNAVITHDPLPTIEGDEHLKVQLFQNLIGNAIKYRSPETPKIHISAKKENNQYIFSIKDNGIGISPEHLQKIFTIFQRLHTHEEHEGTGIGLAIAQKIVHQQGGKIWVESEPGKGSTFYFTIPTN